MVGDRSFRLDHQTLAGYQGAVMNWYFKQVWLPLQVVTVLAITCLALGVVDVSLWQVGVLWFLLGPLGIGVGFHRLFSHRSFDTYRPIEIGLAVLGTLAAYAPLSFWISTHVYHHTHADSDKDPSTPRKGFWESFLMHRMRQSMLRKIKVDNYCFRIFHQDPTLRKISDNFVKLFVLTLVVLSIWPPLLVAYIFAVNIEHLRINSVNFFSHKSVFGSYRNFDTDDQSYNNWILGYLTLGFAWHNNHHAKPVSCSLHLNWWEVDVEGLLCSALSRRISTRSN